MTPQTGNTPSHAFRGRAVGPQLIRLVSLALSFVMFGLVLTAGSASAKEAVARIEGAGDGDVAVNVSGAGPADQHDIYVINNNQIQRFAQDDNGTPVDPYDDSYPFVASFGSSGSGNGGLSSPRGIAIDQDTGDVYVSDTENRRINVYSGDGIFRRSFGWGVVASGPGDKGAGYEVCVAANGDVCIAGTQGSGIGQLGRGRGIAVSQPDGNAASGTVFVADAENRRMNTYGLDGTSPSSFGSTVNFSAEAPEHVVIDSRGIVYATDRDNTGEIERYDSQNATGGGVGFLGSIGPDLSISGGFTFQPFIFKFTGAFGYKDVSQMTVSNGTTALSGGTGAKVTTTITGDNTRNEEQQLTIDAKAGQYKLTFNGETTDNIKFDAERSEVLAALFALPSLGPGPLSSVVTQRKGLEVDPDSDGLGPDGDVLYVIRDGGEPITVVQQFGPANAPGLVVPPAAEDAKHGAATGFSFVGGLGLDESNGRLFVSTNSISAPKYGSGPGLYVLDEAGGLPSASLDSLSDVTATTVTVHGTIDPNGPPPVSYRIEYSTDGSAWAETPEITVGVQETPQDVEAVLNPPPGGLEPGTFYHVRLKVTKVFNPPVITSEETFTTLPSPPEVETTGSPSRTRATARLEGRVNPRGTAATYHFEYGSEGPCETSPCASTPSQAAGFGNALELVSEAVEGLEPGTTYHYRLVADNGNPGSPVSGEDMTVTTRASDAALSHGHFPGPVGSDRAYELVSVPENGGNPVSGAVAFSDDGSRAAYQIAGGTPVTETGSVLNQFLAERTSSGWEGRAILPPRDQLSGPNWAPFFARGDLSSMLSLNNGIGKRALWRLTPNAGATELFEPTASQETGFYASAADSNREVAELRGGELDPAFPGASAVMNLYDVTSGLPQLVSIMPGGDAPACGVDQPAEGHNAARWVSPGGALAFFRSTGDSCGGAFDLYVRDMEAGETKLISGAAISGSQCNAILVKSTDDAVFFWTQSRLVAEDSSASGCGGFPPSIDGDVYRYDLVGDALQCVTCVVAGLDADVLGVEATTAEAGENIAVAEDGSRVYFRSAHRLLTGAPVGEGLYRITVQSGDLRWIADPGAVKTGEYSSLGGAINPDGSVLIFRSQASSLNPLGGDSDNGGTFQYYRYDDRDRSLVCVSCPPSGSTSSDVTQNLVEVALLSFNQAGPNLVPLSDDGRIFAFQTVSALAAPDQNTPGPAEDPRMGADVYEWRDGRLLLVSDGLTNWPSENSMPKVNGVSPSGEDVFFTAAAQYTPDALDGYYRLYDARIGGGFEFLPRPKPCPLEVCQGTPKGAPAEAMPGSASILGPGNLPRRRVTGCAKGKRKVRQRGKARCVRVHGKKRQSKTNHDRRSQR